MDVRGLAIGNTVTEKCRGRRSGCRSKGERKRNRKKKTERKRKAFLNLRKTREKR
jgi:hypothetical protein